ncbi:MAG: replicative DNA helicase [Verrucomicrobia bacterium]|nr:replicative DNA helicase [Verrucomicrobiota bacterium]
MIDRVDLQKAKRKRSKRDSSQLNRVPPHSIEAEQGVLGCLMLSPNDKIGITVEKLKTGSEAFYDLRHKQLYELLLEMYDKNDVIDPITVPQKLKDRNQLEMVGGLAYLTSLVDAVPSAANLPYYLDIVREKLLLRRLIQACDDVVNRVHDYEGDVDELVDEVERDILRISEQRVESDSTTIKDLVFKAINTIELYHQRQGLLTGIGTGFRDLDKLTSGFHPGEMVVLAARPSVGKTSLAMNMVEHIIAEQKLPVGVFSLEMTAESLVLRMICSMARVNLRSIREGFVPKRDFPKLTAAAGKLAGAPLYIDDTPGLSILQLRAKARRMSQQYGTKLFVIDYLQLLHSTSVRRSDNRQQEIADISNGIKALAKELEVPVIVLSQLNREMERDKSRKPRLSDLRESGAIEQDADVVGLLYRPSDSDNDQPPADEHSTEPVDLIIAKQRNGPTGDVNLMFFKHFTRFESAAKISTEDMPDQ